MEKCLSTTVFHAISMVWGLQIRQILKILALPSCAPHHTGAQAPIWGKRFSGELYPDGWSEDWRHLQKRIWPTTFQNGGLHLVSVEHLWAVRLVDSGAVVGFQVVSVSVLFAFTQLELWTV